jgi:hypothetical protein
MCDGEPGDRCQQDSDDDEMTDARLAAIAAD